MPYRSPSYPKDFKREEPSRSYEEDLEFYKKHTEIICYPKPSIHSPETLKQLRKVYITKEK